MKNSIFFLILILYIIYNSLVLATYGMDKYYAVKKQHRIPEKKLMSLAFFFGGPGAFLGMQIFRHKTKHLQFQILVPIFMILQIIAWTVVSAIIIY